MAQYDFWGNDDDVCDMVKAILATGEFAVTPDVSMPTDKERVYWELNDDLARLILEKRMLFVTGPFSGGEIVFRDFTNDRGELFVLVDTFRSAQHIVFSQPYCKKQTSFSFLSPGDIQLPRAFGDGRPRVWQPSEETKAAYEQIIKIVKDHTLPWPPHPTVRIGKKGYAMLLAGEAFIKFVGNWHDARGNIVVNP